MSSTILVANTGDDHVLSDIRDWMLSCTKHHRCADWEHTVRFRPPRLLEIQGDRVRLIDTRQICPHGCYATLSYRWGPPPHPLRLTPETFPRLVSGIDVKDLPKTFQDAVSIAKRLHDVSCLWIDSLCIIQSGPDHANDWLEHVGQMDTIYQHGLINIAAVDSENADHGILCNREIPPIVNPLKAVLDFRQESKLLPDHPYWIVDLNAWDRLTGTFPLDGRGWVFQERTIAPRTVLFGKDQVYRECTENPFAMCELLGAEGIKREANTLPLDFNIAKGWRKRNVTIPYEWLRNVTRYSDTSLTRGEDKLPAIAGVAKRFCSDGDKYFTGIFESMLPWSLLWKPISTITRAKPYRAPSWSWAGYDGVVTFQLLRFASRESAKPTGRCLARVEDMKANLVNPKDMFGQVQDAEMVLHGPTLTVSWRTDVKSLSTPKECQIRVPPVDHSFRQSNFIPSHQTQRLLSRRQHFEGTTLICDDISNQTQYSDAALVIINEDLIEVPNNGPKGCRFMGLMLVPSSDQINRWMRIGTFMLSANGVDAYQTLCNAGVRCCSFAIV